MAGVATFFMDEQSMPKSPPPGKAQRERFEQTARELGVDLDEEKLKEALRKMGYPDTVRRNERADPEDTK